MAPPGKRSYPRDKLFMSTAANGKSYLYFIAGKWLRRVCAQTGQVVTLLDVVSGSGMRTWKDVAALDKPGNSLWCPTNGIKECECGAGKKKLCVGGLPDNTISNIM